MQSKGLNIDSTINKISDFAPVVLFVVMILIFVATGYLQNEYYKIVFASALEDTMYIAFLFPVIVQTLRLVTGFLSASFFKKQRYFIGSMVFLFSLWLTVFEHKEAMHMGQFWTAINIDLTTITQMENAKISLVKDSITTMVRILVWSALVLEFFLAFWLGMKKDDILTNKLQNVNIKKTKATSNGVA